MSSNFFPDLPARAAVDPKTGNAPTNNPQEAAQANYEQSVRMWMEAAWEEAKYENLMGEDIREMTKTMDYLLGKQWPQGRPSYKARPVNNRIWRLFWELVAVLTDVRPMFDIRTMNPLYQHHADILNKVTRSWWMESDADQTLAMIIVYGLLCTGFAKLEWNPLLRNGEGDFSLLALGPNDVLPLKARHDLETAQAVVYNSPQPVGWFRQKFGKKGEQVKADPAYSRFSTPNAAPGNMPNSLFQMLGPAMRRVMGASQMTMHQSAYPMALYREFWIRDFSVNQRADTLIMGNPDSNWCYRAKPGMPLYPRGRLICMGGPFIMYDGPNPYWHGRFPFSALRMNVVPWQFHGLSEMKPLIDMQDIVNNILAGILDMVKKAINPSFLSPKNAFSDGVFNAIDWSMPGSKAQYSMQSPHPPQFAPAPVLPGFVLNTLTLAAREMDASSGLASISEAVRKKQVPAADTLEQIKQTQQTPIRLKGRNIEQFLRRIGSMNISNVFQFYSAERRMFMLGPDGLTYEDFDYKPSQMVPDNVEPEQHIKNFAFLIHPGTLLNINQVEKQMLVLKLRSMKDIDRKTMYKQLDMGLDADQIEKNLETEMRHQLDDTLSAQVMAHKAMAAATPGGGQ